MQQDSINKLGFSSKKTMSVAQQLYEGVEIGKETTGLITYMRTDSTRISPDAVASTMDYIENNYGKEYKGSVMVKKGSKVKAQDAHETIRPTDITKTPEKIKRHLSIEQYRLYKLIWSRFIASLMAPAVFDSTAVYFVNGIYTLKSSASVLKFDGFKKVYEMKVEEEEDSKLKVSVSLEDSVKAVKYVPSQHFTKPPKNYTEASLVKELESGGIGRPSTYSSIISTLLDRKYCIIEEKKIKTTELGRTVNEVLHKNFKKVFDTNFTAILEKELDNIEEGSSNMTEILSDFYNSFSEEVKNAKKNVSANLELKGIKCEKCGAKLNVKYGKKGIFAACSKYPDCNFTSNFKRNEENGEITLVKEIKEEGGMTMKCDKCGADMNIKKNKLK